MTHTVTPMSRQRWNRLFCRALRAMKATPKRYHEIKDAWLKWADRVTGMRCFFLYWND